MVEQGRVIGNTEPSMDEQEEPLGSVIKHLEEPEVVTNDLPELEDDLTSLDYAKEMR